MYRVATWVHRIAAMRVSGCRAGCRAAPAGRAAHHDALDLRDLVDAAAEERAISGELELELVISGELRLDVDLDHVHLMHICIHACIHAYIPSVCVCIKGCRCWVAPSCSSGATARGVCMHLIFVVLLAPAEPEPEPKPKPAP